MTETTEPTDEAPDELKRVAWQALKEFAGEQYLGDGLYCSFSFDGMQINLRAPRMFENHFVILEPDTLRAFEAYVAHLRKILNTVQVQL